MGEGGSLDLFLTGLDNPMFIVTTMHPVSRKRAGCPVGFASQCSIEPDRFVVWLSQNNLWSGCPRTTTPIGSPLRLSSWPFTACAKTSAI